MGVPDVSERPKPGDDLRGSPFMPNGGNFETEEDGGIGGSSSSVGTASAKGGSRVPRQVGRCRGPPLSVYQGSLSQNPCRSTLPFEL